MKELLESITRKKADLDSQRPLPAALDKNLYEWCRIALTYSSNALEGNTLSLAETAQVVEKGLTVGGKSIVEHLEAINHAQAIDFIHNLAKIKKREQAVLSDILDIHKIILQNINTPEAGRLRQHAVRVTGFPLPCPNYVKVPALMNDLIASAHTATIAAQAHLELVTIHPFVDGNGRTARLLMNLLLLQEEYPLVIIDVKDRAPYIQSIQRALAGDSDAYYHLIYRAIERSLDEYLTALSESKK